MKTHTLHISGTHCPSCKILVEDILNEQIGIEKVTVDLKKKTLTFTTELHESPEELATLLSEKIVHNGYTLSVEKPVPVKQESDIWKALPIGVAALVVFFLLQKSDILNFGIGGQVTPVTSFIVGLIASVSSCLAVV